MEFLSEKIFIFIFYVLTQSPLRTPSEAGFPLNNRHGSVGQLPPGHGGHSPGSESAESEGPERSGDEQMRFERAQRDFMLDLMNRSAKAVQVTHRHPCSVLNTAVAAPHPGAPGQPPQVVAIELALTRAIYIELTRAH